MKVLLIGDYCTDIFIEGQVDRLSPEVPVPVFVETSRKETPGMAGNVLANLKSLCPNLIVSPLLCPSRSTKTRYVDVRTGHHFLRVDYDPEQDELSNAKWRGTFDSENWDAVVVSDYNKGYLTDEILGSIGYNCRKTLTPIFVDTKRVLREWSSGAIVKMNEYEYAACLRAGYPACQWAQTLIVTKGGDGMQLYENGAASWHLDAIPIQVRDGAGCGDSVLAALVVRYLENGGNIRDAMEWAGKVGAIAVSKRGVVAVNREEVV